MTKRTFTLELTFSYDEEAGELDNVIIDSKTDDVDTEPSESGYVRIVDKETRRQLGTMGSHDLTQTDVDYMSADHRYIVFGMNQVIK